MVIVRAVKVVCLIFAVRCSISKLQNILILIGTNAHIMNHKDLNMTKTLKVKEWGNRYSLT